MIEGIRGNGYQGDISIDDFSMIDGACPLPGDCDFENGLCTWVNAAVSDGLDQFDWIIGKGGTTSRFTGPSVDHTTGTTQGWGYNK